jgi:hypothetical protein
MNNIIIHHHHHRRSTTTTNNQITLLSVVFVIVLVILVIYFSNNTNNTINLITTTTTDDDNSKLQPINLITDSETGLITLDLTNQHLSKLPSHIIPILHQVDILFLSNNEFTDIPHELEILASNPNAKLSRLSLKNNKLHGELNCQRLPNSLVHLILTGNQISSIPSSTCTGKFTQLRKLMLARNELYEINWSLFPSLELIRLSENQFQSMNELVSSSSPLPPTLKWISFGSNPCCPVPSPQHILPIIDLKQICGLDIVLKDGEINPIVNFPVNHNLQVLGSGTSGKVIRCFSTLPNTNNNDYVVKLFNFQSSDGSSQHEIDISALLPKSEILLHPLGVPLFNAGIVYRYLGPVYRPLGKAPDIRLVIKDSFPQTLHQLPFLFAINVTRSMLCALHFIHEVGIVHGDFYAHNILFDTSFINSGPAAVLLDFGAASYISSTTTSKSIRDALFETDWKAFRILVHEIRTELVVDALENGNGEHVTFIKELDELTKLGGSNSKLISHHRGLCPEYII